MVLKQKKNFLRGWKSASLEAFAATQAMPKKFKAHVLNDLIHIFLNSNQ